MNCPHCQHELTRSEIGKLYNGLRHTHGAGPGRPRNTHAFVNSDLGGFDSNCSVCGGKHRDAVHEKPLPITGHM